jgi:hypothetical protein
VAAGDSAHPRKGYVMTHVEPGHLNGGDAHLETRAILTPEQVAQYDKLRGYTETGTSSRDHAGGHQH